VHIRSATVADIPSIIKLELQSATAGHWTEKQYRQAFQRGEPTRLVLVAEDSETSPAGFLVAQHLATHCCNPQKKLTAPRCFLKSANPTPPRDLSTKKQVSSGRAAASPTIQTPPKTQSSTALLSANPVSHTETAPLFWH
jgi:hypothetical protein